MFTKKYIVFCEKKLSKKFRQPNITLSGAQNMKMRVEINHRLVIGTSNSQVEKQHQTGLQAKILY